MKLLTLAQTQAVAGGSNTDAVAKNAATAVATCGAGNVKSVSTTGFECK
jgi:hypothetical protein